MARFAKELAEQANPEWLPNFIDYTKLKKIVHKYKDVRHSARQVLMITVTSYGIIIHMPAQLSKTIPATASISVTPIQSNQNTPMSPTSAGSSSERSLEDSLPPHLAKFGAATATTPTQSIDGESILSQQKYVIGKDLRSLKEQLEVLKSKVEENHDIEQERMEKIKEAFDKIQLDPDKLERQRARQARHDKMRQLFGSEELLEVEELPTTSGKLRVVSQMIARSSVCTRHFFKKLNKELTKVNRFFIKQEGRIMQRHLVLMKQTYLMKVQNKFTKRKLSKLKTAFKEHYKTLELLHRFRKLNHEGFKRIIKKYQKYTKNEVKKYYYDILNNQYFQSAQVMDTMRHQSEQIAQEILYPNKGHKNALHKLKLPSSSTTRKQVNSSFHTGFWLGTSVLFTAAWIFYYLASYMHIEQNLDALRSTSTLYLFRLALFPIVLIFLIGLDVRIWNKYHVNYIFIFELNPRRHMNEMQLMRIPLVWYCIWCLFYLGFMLMTVTDYYNGDNTFGGLSWILVFIFYGLMLLWIFNPLPLLYRSARAWLITIIARIALAPFYRVTFRDFWVADQLCSMSTFLFEMQFLLCITTTSIQEAYGSSTLSVCNSYVAIGIPILNMWPYYARLMQCVRRFKDTKQTVHIWNAGKYMSSILTLLVYMFDSRIFPPANGSWSSVRTAWFIFNVGSTVYKLVWDLYMDWGLLRGFKKNENGQRAHYPLLRHELLFRPWIYYLAVIVNTTIRFVWIPLLILRIQFPDFFQWIWIGFITASLELLRRGLWNIFRLENEHLTNVGQFRVTRDIPLPFENYGAEDNKLSISRSKSMLERFFSGLIRRVCFCFSISTNKTMWDMDFELEEEEEEQNDPKDEQDEDYVGSGPQADGEYGHSEVRAFERDDDETDTDSSPSSHHSKDEDPPAPQQSKITPVRHSLDTSRSKWGSCSDLTHRNSTSTRSLASMAMHEDRIEIVDHSDDDEEEVHVPEVFETPREDAAAVNSPVVELSLKEAERLHDGKIVERSNNDEKGFQEDGSQDPPVNSVLQAPHAPVVGKDDKGLLVDEKEDDGNDAKKVKEAEASSNAGHPSYIVSPKSSNGGSDESSTGSNSNNKIHRDSTISSRKHLLERDLCHETSPRTRNGFGSEESILSTPQLTNCKTMSSPFPSLTQKQSSLLRHISLFTIISFLSISTIISLIWAAYYQITNVGNSSASPSSPEPCHQCSHLSQGLDYAVASDHRSCSQIGVNILRMEGNAIDAAVATSFCIGVMNMFSAGIGGGGIMLISDASAGGARSEDAAISVIDSREKAPAAADRDMFVGKIQEAQVGGKAIAVPGEVLGLHTAWKKHGSGKIPWHYLVEPSVALARGHRVSSLVETVLESQKDTIMTHPALDEFRRVFAPNGKLLKEGDYVRNEKLADTLQIIAKEGAETFYNGTLAGMIAQDIQDVGGILVEKDLSEYTVRETAPYCTDFFGYRVCTAKPEISGGVCNIMALNMLEKLLTRIPIFKKDTSFAKNKLLFHHYTIEAMKWVFSHRMHLGDPDFVDVEDFVANMLSKAYAGRVVEKVKDDRTLDDFHEYAPLNDTLYGDVPNAGTAHFSVVDKERRSVAYTSTINLYFGSMVLGKRTGIIFNDQMDDFSTPGEYNAFNVPPSKANFIAPGKRPLSSMSPTIIYQNGEFYMSVGASGGPIIITAVMQTILNVLVFQQSLDAAVGNPRFHHQLLPPVLAVDKEWDTESIEYFKSLGHELKMVDFDKHQSLAVVQAVVVNDDGGIDAVADWRKPAGWSYAI